MTPEEEIGTLHLRIAETAAGMLDGSVPFIEGVRTLTHLLNRAGVARNDEDFDVLVAADSETDDLPVGEVRRHWAPEALQRLEPEIDAATAWAKQFASEACESLVARFGS